MVVYTVYICNDESCSTRYLYNVTDDYNELMEWLNKIPYDALVFVREKGKLSVLKIVKKDGEIIHLP